MSAIEFWLVIEIYVYIYMCIRWTEKLTADPSSD